MVITSAVAARYRVATAFGLGILLGLPVALPAGWLWMLLAATALGLFLRRHAAYRTELLSLSLAMGGYLAAALFWLGLAVYRPPANGIGSTALICTALLMLHTALYAIGYGMVRGLGPWLGVPRVASQALALVLGLPLAEGMRCSGIWAMPWAMQGDMQIDNPLLAPFYPLVGAPGVTALFWMLAWSLGAVVADLHRPTRPAWLRRLRHSTAFWALLAWVAVAWPLRQLEWTHALDAPRHVNLVHTQWPGDERYDPAVQTLGLMQLQDAASQFAGQLVIFPELFLVEPAEALHADYRQQLLALLQQHRTEVILGAPLTAMDGVHRRQYNAALALDGTGAPQWYLKERLLPFSEYYPEHWMIRWAYRFLYRYPMADLLAGPVVQPGISLAGVDLGLTICSELAYPDVAARQAQAAQLLVNISNDGWVPSRSYFRQALMIARVRAAEANKPLVRANNVGFSAIIGTRGELLQSWRGAPTVLRGAVLPRTGQTPYMRLRQWLATRVQ
ncbi:apolipoprotein N-acyltransferase [Corticibacter populi]|nr:apolipoprotein N-acyltransferase [Corticibacter populi]